MNVQAESKYHNDGSDDKVLRGPMLILRSGKQEWTNTILLTWHYPAIGVGV